MTEGDKSPEFMKIHDDFILNIYFRTLKAKKR